MIVFASNSTGWDHSRDELIRDGQVDLLIRPVMAHLPDGACEVARQPAQDAVNVYLSNRDRYVYASRGRDRVGVHYAHGIASKGYRRWQRTRTFDVITVPGPAHEREVIASGAPAERVVQIGYPKLDPLFRGELHDPGIWAGDGRIRVVYAPTHGGGSEHWSQGNRGAPGAKASSWWHRDDVMRLLSPDHFDVVLCPHPRHSPGGHGTLRQYIGADVVIADGGSTIYEAMALGIPVVLTSWLTRRRNSERQGGTLLEAQVYTRRLGYHADHARDLPELVRKAAAEGLGAAERTFIEDVLPAELRGTSGERFAELLLEFDQDATKTPRRPGGRPGPRDAPPGPPLRRRRTMTEPTPQPQPPEGGPAGDPPTPEDEPLGEGGKKALTSEREARRAAEKALAERDARIKEFEDRDKSELQKAQDAAQTAEQQAAEAQREALRYRVAVKHGISHEDAETFLTGADEETIARQAERLAALRGDVAGPATSTHRPTPTGRLKTGSDPTQSVEETDPRALAERVPRY